MPETNATSETRRSTTCRMETCQVCGAMAMCDYTTVCLVSVMARREIEWSYAIRTVDGVSIPTTIIIWGCERCIGSF